MERIYNNTIDYGQFFVGVACDKSDNDDYHVHFADGTGVKTVVYEDRNQAFRVMEKFENKFNLI